MIDQIGQSHSATENAKNDRNVAASQGLPALDNGKDGVAVQNEEHADKASTPSQEAATVKNAVEVSGQRDVDPQHSEAGKAAPHEGPGNALGDIVRNVTQNDGGTKQASAVKQFASVTANTASNPPIRLYTSENRMWHAVAGHSPDLNKIKALDFACLSIIAACGSKGVYQHDLVKISGQDKRSLPARTERLYEDGYIEKKRVRIREPKMKRLLNTSHLVLTRFVKSDPDRIQQPELITGPVLLVEKKTREDGEQVEGQVRQALGRPFSQDAQQSKPEAKILSKSRPIPQWTADRSLSNQIFDLVDQSGTQGITMTVC